jgi:hypothetical protein
VPQAAPAKASELDADYQFPGVMALDATHGPKAATQLRIAHKGLVEGCASSAAHRLREMDGEASRLDVRLLEKLAAPANAVDELADAQQARVRRLMLWRNALVLLPLVFTWVSLAWASHDYHQQLVAHPDMGNQPFLLLWQESFGGRFIPTFAEIAFLDFLLIAGVVALTVAAHRAEGAAARLQGRVAGALDAAMADLAIAVDRNVVGPGGSAKDWAAAAQRIIADAMDETRQLAAVGKETIKAAKIAQEEGKEFIRDLSKASREAMLSVREENRQFIVETSAAAMKVLQEATTANRNLIQQQMNPLVGQLQTMLTEFGQHHETYRVGAADLTAAVGSLNAAAGTLASSASSYPAIAKAISDDLTSIKKSQGDFIERVTASANSMGVAATAMQGVSEVLRTEMHDDLQKIAQNVVDASGRLATVDLSLTGTSRSLGEMAAALATVTRELDAAAATLRHGLLIPRTSRWPRWLPRPSNWFSSRRSP